MKQASKIALAVLALGAALSVQAQPATAAQLKAALAQQGLPDPYGANEIDKVSDAAAHAKLLRAYEKVAGAEDDRNEMDKENDRALAERLERQALMRK